MRIRSALLQGRVRRDSATRRHFVRNLASIAWHVVRSAERLPSRNCANPRRDLVLGAGLTPDGPRVAAVGNANKIPRRARTFSRRLALPERGSRAPTLAPGNPAPMSGGADVCGGRSEESKGWALESSVFNWMRSDQPARGRRAESSRDASSSRDLLAAAPLRSPRSLLQVYQAVFPVAEPATRPAAGGLRRDRSTGAAAPEPDSEGELRLLRVCQRAGCVHSRDCRPDRTILVPHQTQGPITPSASASASFRAVW